MWSDTTIVYFFDQFRTQSNMCVRRIYSLAFLIATRHRNDNYYETADVYMFDSFREIKKHRRGQENEGKCYFKKFYAQ